METETTHSLDTDNLNSLDSSFHSAYDGEEISVSKGEDDHKFMSVSDKLQTMQILCMSEPNEDIMSQLQTVPLDEHKEFSNGGRSNQTANCQAWIVDVHKLVTYLQAYNIDLDNQANHSNMTSSGTCSIMEAINAINQAAKESKHQNKILTERESHFRRVIAALMEALRLSESSKDMMKSKIIDVEKNLELTEETLKESEATLLELRKALAVEPGLYLSEQLCSTSSSPTVMDERGNNDLQSLNTDLVNRLRSTEEFLSEARSRESVLKAANADLTSEVCRLKASLSESASRESSLKVGSIRALLADAKTKESDLKAANADLMSEISSIRALLSEARSRESDLQVINADLVKKVDVFGVLLSEASSRESDLKAVYVDLVGEVSDVREFLSELRSMDLDLKSNIAGIVSDVRRDRLLEASSRESDLTAANTDQHNQISTSMTELPDLKTAKKYALESYADIMHEVYSLKVALSIAMSTEVVASATTGTSSPNEGSLKAAVSLAVSAEEREMVSKELSAQVNGLQECLVTANNRIAELGDEVSEWMRQSNSNETHYRQELASLQEELVKAEDVKGSMKIQLNFKDRSLQESEEKLKKSVETVLAQSEDIDTLKNELCDLQVALASEKIISMNKDKTLLETEESLIQTELNMKRVEDNLKKAEEKISELQDDLFISKEFVISEKTSRTKAEKEIHDLKVGLSVTARLNEGRDDKIVGLQETQMVLLVQEMQHKVTAAESEIELLNDQNNVYQHQMSLLREAFSNRENVIAAKDKEIRRLELELEYTFKELNPTSEALNAVEQENKKLSSNLLVAESQSETALKTIKELEKRLLESELQLKTANEREDGLKTVLERLKSDLTIEDGKKSRINELRRKLSECENDLAAERNRCETLEAQVAYWRQSRSCVFGDPVDGPSQEAGETLVDVRRQLDTRTHELEEELLGTRERLNSRIQMLEIQLDEKVEELSGKCEDLNEVQQLLIAAENSIESLNALVTSLSKASPIIASPSVPSPYALSTRELHPLQKKKKEIESTDSIHVQQIVLLREALTVKEDKIRRLELRFKSTCSDRDSALATVNTLESEKNKLSSSLLVTESERDVALSTIKELEKRLLESELQWTSSQPRKNELKTDLERLKNGLDTSHRPLCLPETTSPSESAVSELQLELAEKDKVILTLQESVKRLESRLEYWRKTNWTVGGDSNSANNLRERQLRNDLEEKIKKEYDDRMLALKTQLDESVTNEAVLCQYIKDLDSQRVSLEDDLLASTEEMRRLQEMISWSSTALSTSIAAEEKAKNRVIELEYDIAELSK